MLELKTNYDYEFQKNCEKNGIDMDSQEFKAGYEFGKKKDKKDKVLDFSFAKLFSIRVK